MYIFKSSFLRANNITNGYEDINLTNVILYDILNNYIDGYIVLTHTHLTGTFYLELMDLRMADVPIDVNMKFSQWLGHNHRRELPTSKTKPNYIQQAAIYADAFFNNFKVNRVAPFKDIDANVSNADKVNLLIQKNIPNPTELYTKVLVTVNGFTHRSEFSHNGLTVIHGGDTFNNTGVNTVGIISFANCCDIRQYAIEDSMIAPVTSTSVLSNELLIKLGEPIFNKSVMISIGGHLFVSDDVCEIVNYEEGIILVKLAKLDLVKMLLQSVRRIDLDPLGIFAPSEGTTYNRVRIQDIMSDICIRKYLTLPQSFVIIADAHSIQTVTSDLDLTGLPGTYESKEEPVDLLINSQGLISEYWKINKGDYWSVNLTDDITKRYMYATNIDTDNIFTNSMSPTYKWYHDDPKLMRIITTSRTT